MDNFSFSGMGTSGRIAALLATVILAHLAIRTVRYLSHRVSSAEAVQSWSKLRTLAGLITSITVFALYFAALGLMLREFSVSLTAYLASASILGLAIGFGSQGLVQDVVTGLTVIFSDLFHVGDLVEISGQSGIVQVVGMRFTVLINPFGARVFIPNRTLTNVILYPRGFLRCYADITLSTQEETATQMLKHVTAITHGFAQQFPGILRSEPKIGPCESAHQGRTFVRVEFRIWPGRGGPIETAYKQEIVQSMKNLDGQYADWMVSVNNEIRETPAAIRPFRLPPHLPSSQSVDDSHDDTIR